MLDDLRRGARVRVTGHYCEESYSSGEKSRMLMD
jgi:hypothetical protein